MCIKKIIAINLLLIYALALIKPFVPVVDYLMHEKYIAANLCENKSNTKMCCNGKCYMAKQLKKAASENKKNNSPTTINSDNLETLFCLKKNNLTAYFLPKFSSKIISIYTEKKSAKAILEIFHPPTFTA
ncbi:MAG: hypothetical protein ABI199_05745 [Bacteroidia bacterium]